MVKLKKVEDVDFTITRRKYGRGFQYFWLDGEKIDCKQTLGRCKKMVIPPMWNDVKICELENGHIQATGYDLKQRKQYIYHPYWQSTQQQAKFKRILEFAEQLPAIRKHCLSLLKTPHWSKERVLAIMVLVLDETGIRIGNDKYSNTNKTYGLTTLRRKHVQMEDDSLTLSFTGKSHKEREIDIEDPLLLEHVKQCAVQPGYSLFRYKDTDGNWQDLDSEDVNEFIQSLIGEAYSSKDFRTWNGTRLAYELLPQAEKIVAESGRKKLMPTLVKLVAAELGNTPNICRQYYIHPKLLTLIEENKLTVELTLSDLDDPVENPELSASEREILALLNDS